MLGPDFHLSLEDNTFAVSDTKELTAETLIQGIEDLKGDPPEQVKAVVSKMASELVESIATTIGWPGVINSYGKVKVSLRLSGGEPPKKHECSDINCFICDTYDISIDFNLDGEDVW